MSTTPRPEQQADWKASLLERFRDPAQARLILAGAVLAIAYFGVWWPLGGQVTSAARGVTTQLRQLELVKEITALRADLRLAEKHLPPLTPVPGHGAPRAAKTKGKPAATAARDDEWARHVLSGLRPLRVKLVALDAGKPCSVGPYKVAVLKIALEGKFADLNAFLVWLDTNERLTRTDRVKFEADPSATTATLQLTVLGITN